MTEQPSSASPRLYYLDALRVIAILFVFLFHAVHPFDLNGWHVKNIEQSLTLTVILVILWMWGMPFFFLIAGAGSRLALRRRSAKEFAIERTRRLGVPLIFLTIASFFIATYFEWGNRVYRMSTAISFPGLPAGHQRLVSGLWLFSHMVVAGRPSVVPGVFIRFFHPIITALCVV